MSDTDYWFTRAEHDQRIARVQQILRSRGQDALIAFMPESITWLTGYFTRAYGGFQFAIIPASGEPFVVLRDVEKFHFDRTSHYSDCALWSDSDVPLQIGVQAIERFLGKQPKLAVELSAWTLSVTNYLALKDALPGAWIEDAGSMVAALRLIKSPAEVAFQRRAARAAEAGMQAGIDSAQAGASERDMAASICSAMILQGSDLPGPGVLSSGERAFHLHGSYSDRILETGDLVQLETTPNVRQYHARFMRPMKVGMATDAEYRLAETLIDIQDRALAAVAPGVCAAVPDAIYREGVLGAGLGFEYTNKTFYSVGLMLLPNSGEMLSAVPESQWVFEPGMVFHSYVLAQGMGMSETVHVHEGGCERLTHFPRQLFVT
ncbi:MAG: Xaa-Pro peptidase family protein [Gluconobacter potus]|uniref:Aminopeptidase P family protein n=1 Tax=Gluconobacter potus TaxID=2724927 RepID=A0ABR9YQY3_9PROT|nr:MULTISPECIES: Xaa-Pro peptidase family protein [Gluconobacter]MBF0865833.1 aminopeptidase P family protein [Gluconobacter sp. R71656]MBF0868955.1 aminopeptidase P family protein [Gluconobacter sp. R75628]MBF0874939.1 aminopeptidase P family protein [Gluconobacter sp. R75629]MBF0883868.1 aminopeptidase P family protein [Gluconobacter potus]